MSFLRRLLVFLGFLAGLLGLASCGSDSDVTSGSSASTDSEEVTGDHDEDHDEPDEDDDHDDHDEDDGHDDELSGGLDAHVHGAAELFVAVSGSDIVIDLVSPAINIFGFEYEPETAEDQAFAAERLDALSAPDLIGLNVEAECELAGDIEPDVVFEESHAEITTAWQFVCAEPGDIKDLDLSNLFAEFSGMVDIDAQWVSEDTQSAAELTPSSAVLRFD